MTKTKLPRLVTILIITTITIVFWIAVDVYRALTVKPADPVPGEIIAPLDPNLNESALRSIEQRVYIEENEIQPLSNQNLVVQPTPTPLATVAPAATVQTSASPNPSPTP